MNRGIREIALALALEITPAALFGGSVGLAAIIAGGQPLMLAGGAGALAFGSAWAALHRLGREGESALDLPAFEVDALPEVELAEEIEATVEIVPVEQPAAEELLLDDVLADLPPDSRVVRLFDSRAVPTAGELQAQIDRHLRTVGRPEAVPDATHELHQALDELRRSLR